MVLLAASGDTFTWEPWSRTLFSGLIGAIVGSLSTITVEWFRSKRDRDIRKHERREDFQSRSLVEPKDALAELHNVAGQLFLTFARGEKAPPDNLIGSASLAEGRVLMLKNRINDEAARKTVHRYIHEMRDIQVTNFQYKKEDLYNRSNVSEEKIGEANNRIGEQLRSL